MRLLGLSGVRRDTKVRTTIPAKDGKRAGDLLDRDFTAPAPNRVSDHRLQLLPQLGRLGLRGLHRRRVRPADCGIARRDTKATDLVMTPLRMALWQGGREGYPSPGS